MRRVWRTVPTVRVELDGGDWVEIKTKRLLGDRQAIDQATVTGRITSRDGEVELGQLALGAALPATLVRMITGWGGPGFCQLDHGEDGSRHFDPGDPRPEGIVSPCRPEKCTAEAIVNLDDGTAQAIFAEIEARNPVAKRGESANPTSADAASN